MSAAASTATRRQVRSELTRAHILDAALVEFSTLGYEAASTRAIAARAGVHQPLIHYHFDNKETLWRAAVDRLFAELDAALLDVGAGDLLDDVALLEWVIRRFVRFASRRPELNRIMVQEATHDSDRLDWIVDTHVRARFEWLSSLLGRAAAPALRELDPLALYYSLVGATSLLYVNAPEARRMSPEDPMDERIIAQHEEALIAMFIGPSAAGTTDRARHSTSPEDEEQE